MVKICCIGGGTGLFAVLSALKEHYSEAELSAIVSMMDSGGSTGRLRVDFGYLPPGDVRKCLVALSDAPKDMLELISYRFSNGGDLEGHSLGNLILTAAKETANGEYEAIELVEQILRVRGKVYPVTLDNCHLLATLADGRKIEGETNIDIRNDLTPIESLELIPPAKIFFHAKNALENADIILIGPGDLYSSILPNLIVGGMKETLVAAKNNGAKVGYIVNAMTKSGETDGYTAQTFVEKIRGVLGEGVLDFVILNTGAITEEQKAAYAKENAVQVENDLEQGNYAIIAQDLVKKQSLAHYDHAKLADAIRNI